MERPILFSGPMVRAILEGRKTQTRRAVKTAWIPTIEESARVNGHPALECLAGDIVQPYGSIGSRLWVREMWAAPHHYDGHIPREIPEGVGIHYAATEERGGLLWRPSIHMPRWVSRIALEITGVRVERLHGISLNDARAEGVDQFSVCSPIEFKQLWESINGKKHPWDSNPWVWVIEFTKN